MAGKKRVDPLIGQVGWCNGQTLGLDRGHYVFIRRVYGDKCSVNTFTSIKTKKGKYKQSKIEKIEDGTIYPIPVQDTNLTRFSGVHKQVIKNVPVDEISFQANKTLKRRHHHYIQKHVKK